LALLLRRTLTLLRLRSCLALLLRGSLTLLRLRKRLALLLLLLLRSHFALLWRYLALLLRGSLALLRLRKRLALLLRRSLTLLRLRNCLALLLLRSRLALLLLRNPLALLLLRRSLTLLLLRSRLALLLLLYSPIGCPQRRWSTHIAISRKWLPDSHIGRAAMIGIGKLGAVSAGGTLILHLSTHGRRVRLMHRYKLRRTRRRPDTTRTAVITHAGVVGVVVHRAAVDVVHHRDVDVIDRTVVIEMAAAPVTALVAESYVAIAVIDAAVVADVLAPVARVKPVGVIPVAPGTQ
jgi:hypothetical protein